MGVAIILPWSSPLSTLPTANAYACTDDRGMTEFVHSRAISAVAVASGADAL